MRFSSIWRKAFLPNDDKKKRKRNAREKKKKRLEVDGKKEVIQKSNKHLGKGARWRREMAVK